MIINKKRVRLSMVRPSGPVKVIYLSVDLVYRSAFPLVRVEIYPN